LQTAALWRTANLGTTWLEEAKKEVAKVEEKAKVETKEEKTARHLEAATKVLADAKAA